jgi:hypothetical protein
MRHRIDLMWIDVSEERQFTQDLHGATSQKTNTYLFTVLVERDPEVLLICAPRDVMLHIPFN